MQNGSTSGLPWSPTSHPKIPDRVTKLEVVQGQLQQDAESIMKSVRWASRAGWLIAAELAWLIFRNGLT